MALSDEEFDSLGFTFVWRIENFSFCLEKKGCFIQSPKFVPKVYYDHYEWVMQIYPRGEGQSNDITYQLQNVTAKNQYYFMDLQLTILASDGSLTNYIERERVDLDRTNGTLINHEELFGKKKNFYLPHDTLTLHLRMWKHDDVRSWLGQSFARTHIGVQKSSLFCKFEEKSNFSIVPGLKEKISLKFYFKRSLNCDEKLQMEICETGPSQNNLIFFKISILDTSGNLCHLCSDDHLFEKGEGEKIHAFTLPLSKRTLHLYEELYLNENRYLTLQCDLKLSVGVDYSDLELVEEGPRSVPYVNSVIPGIHQFKRITENVTKHTDSISTDFFKLYIMGTNCDFELRSGSSNFPVHKAVLVARSPVFCNMLSSDMIEKNANMVDIPDVDSDTVKRMLHFLYTDVVHVAEWDAVAKLYFAADKYAIESLKKKCSSFLERNVCASNVCEALELGDLHQGQDLKVAAMEFILRNDDEILNSDEWLQIKKRNSSLAADALQWMFLKKTREK